ALYRVNAKLFDCGLSSERKTTPFTFYPKSSVMSGYYADPQEEENLVKSFILNQQRSGMAKGVSLSMYFSELLEERFKKETFDCSLRTLSDIINEDHIERIDLLKIDVEKSEFDVLAGIKDEDWEKIKQIVIEVHDIKGRLDQIAALLRKQGF